MFNSYNLKELKLKKNVIVLIMLAFALFGCIETIYFMPQYTGIKIENKNLVIENVEVNINNPKDVIDDLGEGDPEKVYKDFFKVNIIDSLISNSTFSNVSFSTILNKSEFQKRTFEFGKKEKISFIIPANGQVVKTDSVYGDIILFIQDYEVKRDVTKSDFEGRGSYPYLGHTFKFVLWDNEQKQVISYGKVDEKTPFLFAMTRMIWATSIKHIMENLLKGTPFENFPEKEVLNRYGG